jgi:hypothetical protein
MIAVTVGNPLVPGRTSWPEQSDFNLYDNGLELRLFFARPSAREVEDVRAGPCEFALRALGDVVFLLYRFGASVAWSDSPFSWWLVPEARRALPSAVDTGETRAVLQVILADAASGIVRALRAVSLSPEFTRALLGAVRVQASTPWCGREDYDRQLAEAYRRYPTSDALLAAATARTAGGA